MIQYHTIYGLIKTKVIKFSIIGNIMKHLKLGTLSRVL